MVSIRITPTQVRAKLRECTPYPSDAGDADDNERQATPTPLPKTPVASSIPRAPSSDIMELTSSDEEPPIKMEEKEVVVKQEAIAVTVKQEEVMDITSSDNEAPVRKRGKPAANKRKLRSRRMEVDAPPAKSEVEPKPLPPARKTRSSTGVSKSSNKRAIHDAALVSSDDELPRTISPAKKPKAAVVAEAKSDLASVRAQLEAATAELAATKAKITALNTEIESPSAAVGGAANAVPATGDVHVKSADTGGQLLPAVEIVPSSLKIGVDDVSTVPITGQDDNPFLTTLSLSEDKGKGRAVQTSFLESLDTQRHFADEADEALRIQDEMELEAALQASRVQILHDNAGPSSIVPPMVCDETRLHPDEVYEIDKAMRATEAGQTSSAGIATGARDAQSRIDNVEVASASVPPSNLQPATGQQPNVRGPRKAFKDVIAPTRVTPLLVNGPVLVDYMQFRISALPDTCGAFSKESQDPFLASDYPSLPNLKYGILKGWGDKPISSVWFSKWADQCPNMDFAAACFALRFVRRGNFINPSRVSPLDVYIEYMGHEKKKSNAHCNGKTAVCLSAIMSQECYLFEPTTTGLKNKYISGYMHHQEYKRFACFACTIFDKKTMTAQINRGAISFTTMGSYKGDRESTTPSKPPRNPSILSDAIRPGVKVKPVKKDNFFKTVLNYTDEVPVYDAREYPFNFDSDLDDIAAHLPLLGDEIPANSFVVVGYTMGHYEKEGKAHLTTNIIFAILLGTEYDT